jgi:Tfp pilus assembly protein PilN
MIEINLLPEEFRQKKQRQIALPQAQTVAYILAAVFGLLIIIHLFLGGLLLVKKIQNKSLDKKWTQLSPQLQEINEWKRQYKISSQQTEQMNRLLNQRITISDRMQALVSALPSGIWFNRLNLKDKKFSLRGSVVSLKADEMRLLNLFLNRLKEDKQFFKDFTRLELGRVVMRTLGGFSVMDFVLEGDLK